MTPLEIEILLHYYARTNDYREGDFSAPAVRSAIDSFVDAELIVPRSKESAAYAIAERGTVYIDALKAVPLPTRKWVMPS